jgi:hypothetical protein
MLIISTPKTVRIKEYVSVISPNGKSPEKKLELATITTSKRIKTIKMHKPGHIRFSFISGLPHAF